VKVGGNQSNRFAEISDYIGNRREMKDSKSVPVGSPSGQNEPPVSIGSPAKRTTQRYIPEDRTLHENSRENLKPCI
jgi:hypothetical protein